MMMNPKMIVSVVLLLVGLFYALAPHDLHVSTGLGFGLDHTMHMAFGVVLIVAGAVMLWKGKKK